MDGTGASTKQSFQVMRVTNCWSGSIFNSRGTLTCALLLLEPSVWPWLQVVWWHSLQVFVNGAQHIWYSQVLGVANNNNKKQNPFCPHFLDVNVLYSLCLFFWSLWWILFSLGFSFTLSPFPELCVCFVVVLLSWERPLFSPSVPHPQTAAYT